MIAHITLVIVVPLGGDAARAQTKAGSRLYAPVSRPHAKMLDSRADHAKSGVRLQHERA
jgi:hypothetical protein